jgi:hypothetical protein
MEYMRRIRRIEAGSYYSYLTEGCRLCRKGAKLVLFVTGECPNTCFYCPISEDRQRKDVIFANERPVRDIEDIVEEVLLMDAEGAAITGGEPLIKLERVEEFISLFSKANMHTHLYTSIPASQRVIERLAKAGLDELRFHPPLLENSQVYEEPLKLAIKAGIEAGFEIPALKFEERLVEIANRYGAFFNVNELEFSASNFDEMQREGFEIGDFYEAKGSREIAEKYAEVVDKFHFCSVLFKDKAQMRRRLIRMAFNHPDFYKVTNEGTIICGVAEGDERALRKVLNLLDYMGEEYVKMDGRVEFSANLAEYLVERIRKIRQDLKDLDVEIGIVERYPTYTRIVVEKTVLE